MRKILLVMIAIFAMGGMCKAEEQSYWLTAESYQDYDLGWGFNINHVEKRSYPVTINFDGDKIVIKGLVKMQSAYTNFQTYAVEGKYDAAKKTITINSPRYNSASPEIENYTKIASGYAYGGDLSILLSTGEFDGTKDSNDNYIKESKDQLVFSVSDDLQTLTAENSFGGLIYSNFTKKPTGGYVEYLTNVTIQKVNAKDNIKAYPNDITFKGNNKVGSQLKSELLLSNLLSEDITYTISTEGDGLSLKRYDSDTQKDIDDDLKLEANGTNIYELYFTPKNEGTCQGKVIFTDAKGIQVVVNVKAEDVKASKNLSAIVKNGDFTFSDGDDTTYPFEISTDITGKPVAVSTNIGDNSWSVLNVAFNIPQGKQGIFSWKGICSAMDPNVIYIYQNDKEIYNDLYFSNGTVVDDDISNAILLKEGEYTFSFKYSKQIDWNHQAEKTEGATNYETPLRAYLYDFYLDTFDQQVFGATLVGENSIDLGATYVDKQPVTLTKTVKVLNSGMWAANIMNVQNSEHFSITIPEEEAIPGDYLLVPITFKGENPFDYDENVSFTMAGGNIITLNCKASIEEIPVDYSSIVTEGDFSFNTSMDFPFQISGNSAKSSLDGVGHSEKKLESWLEATFEVPEGKQGTLSWEGHNSSNTWFEFSGNKTFTDGTRIFIDGKEIKDFNGADTDASSIQLDENDLIFATGTHTIKFLYQRKESKAAGSDRFKVSNLALTLGEAAGINHTDADTANGKTEFFNANGIRLNQLQKGINIVKKNGKVTKLIVK